MDPVIINAVHNGQKPLNEWTFATFSMSWNFPSTTEILAGAKKIAGGPVPVVLPSPAVAQIIRWAPHPLLWAVPLPWEWEARGDVTCKGLLRPGVLDWFPHALSSRHSLRLPARLFNKNVTQVLNISDWCWFCLSTGVLCSLIIVELQKMLIYLLWEYWGGFCIF